MDTFETSRRDSDVYERDTSGIKHKLGQFGRRIKRIDLRSQIIDHPFAAVGIAAGVGAVIGLVRPMPHRSRISGAFMTALTAIGFRLIREAAFVQLAEYAKQRLSGQPPEDTYAEASQSRSSPYPRY